MIAVFETATLADAVARASRVAPTKGAAWDKAQGIRLVHKAGSTHFAVQATNLDTTFLRRVQVDELEDDGDTTWRFPSALLTGVLSSLPMDYGSVVTLSDVTDDRSIKVRCGKALAKLRPLTGDYPVVQPFDQVDLETVPDFAERLAQVAWCVDSAITAPLCGVHLNGTEMIGCDRIRMVSVPCRIPIAEPITAPLQALTDLLRNAEEVSLRAERRRLLLSSDRDTQATTVIYPEPYPDVKRGQRDTFTEKVVLSRNDLDAAIGRMLVLVKGERYPLIKMGFEAGSIGIVAISPDGDRMQDEIPAEGGPATTFVASFTPQTLMGAVNGAGADRVEIHFGPDPMLTTSIRAGDYRADVSPRRP